MDRSTGGTGGLWRAGKRAAAALFLAILTFAAGAAIAGTGHSRSQVVRAGNSWSILGVPPDSLTVGGTVAVTVDLGSS